MKEMADISKDREHRPVIRSQSSKIQSRSLKRRLSGPIDIDTAEKKHPLGLSWWHAIFVFSGVSLLACLLQILLPPPFGLRMNSSEISKLGIAPDGCDDGLQKCICPRETICATDRISMILLALARCSVFFDYPLYMMMFLSKAHNLNNILRRTILREWIDFADMHHVHNIFGIVIGVETMFHSFFHLLRWGINNDMMLLWTSNTGSTGLFAAVCTPIIVWPMVVPKLKSQLSFEVRKGLHYLSWIWAAALCFHAPSRIYYIIGLPAAIYLVDLFFGLFARTHLVENIRFERFGENGVGVQFRNPTKGFDSGKTSYVYIMCPWISKWQWHAFTIFREPTKEDHTMMCIGVSGDWTKEMHAKVAAPCLRSAYILGPFSSEFSDCAVNTTNAIAIATGIGITPTISLMLSYMGKKRVNIIWVCRDPGLIEYFLHKLDIDSVTKNSFAFIFYTGERELLLPRNLPINFFIFRRRPHLEETISGIVAAIHSRKGLPEQMYENQNAHADIPFSERVQIAISRIVTIYSKEEMFEYAVKETIAAESVADNEGDLESDCGENMEATSGTSTSSLSDKSSSNPDTEITSGYEAIPVAEIMDDVVSIQGLSAMICSFLGGIGEYSGADMKNLFELVDTDGSGYIDKDEFDLFIALATGEGHCDDNFFLGASDFLEEDSQKHSLTTRHVGSTRRLSTSSDAKPQHAMFGDISSIQYMKDLSNDKASPLDDWSMFYCGGSNGIEKTLRGIEKKYSFRLGIEKFDW